MKGSLLVSNDGYRKQIAYVSTSKEEEADAEGSPRIFMWCCSLMLKRMARHLWQYVRISACGGRSVYNRQAKKKKT
jgi:hypothetical protein